jgi:hypothetical protein
MVQNGIFRFFVDFYGNRALGEKRRLLAKNAEAGKKL